MPMTMKIVILIESTALYFILSQRLALTIVPLFCLRCNNISAYIQQGFSDSTLIAVPDQTDRDQRDRQ